MKDLLRIYMVMGATIVALMILWILDRSRDLRIESQSYPTAAVLVAAAFVITAILLVR